MEALPTVRLATIASALFTSFALAAQTVPSADGVAYFEQNVRPLLAANCYGCHSTKLEKPMGSLLLDSPVDAFIKANLDAQGLTPQPRVTKLTLIRRVTYDLTGLPPTPSEIDAFVNDHSPQAFEKVVDRLLATLQYGERWGRHWLDIAH